MATPAQCYYCFECLTASYGDEESISLGAVEELWEKHEQFKKPAALQGTSESVSLGESGLPSQQSVKDSGGSDRRGDIRTTRPKNIKLPSVDRLQGQASSDSSLSTTPSTISSNSSQSVFSNSTTPSSISALSDVTSSRQRGQNNQKYPLFVTWNTLSKSGRKSLRGCIGTFEAQELSSGLKSYALTSALDDTRFSPIPASLIPSLSCSLTLLGTFEPCTNAMDWILGTHGIRISFIHRGRRYGATYLPDVPVEQGWTKEETVKSLMHKAGWDGPSENTARRLLRGGSGTNHGPGNSPKPWDQVSDFRAVKYQGLKASANYADWQEWRQWVLSLDDGSASLLTPLP